MIISLIAGTVAACSAVVTTLALARYVRGLKAVGDAGRMPAAVAVVPVAPGASSPAPVLRALAGVPDVAMGIRVACISGDERTLATVVETRGSFPGADLSIGGAEPPARHVPGAWLAAEACAGAGPIVVIAEPCAAPAARHVATALRSQGQRPGGAVAACPAGVPGEPPAFKLAARLLGDLAPVADAVHGHAGIPPVLVVADGDVVARAAADPLARNRASFATSVLVAAGRDAVLLPCPVGMGPGVVTLLPLHLRVLARVSRVRQLAVLGWAAAVPVTLVAWACGGAGAPLVVALASRLALSATWSRSVNGPGVAAVGWVLSPVRDAILALAVLAAMLRPSVRLGGQLYRIHDGGTLAPAAEPADAA